MTIRKVTYSHYVMGLKHLMMGFSLTPPLMAGLLKSHSFWALARLGNFTNSHFKYYIFSDNNFFNKKTLSNERLNTQ